MADNDTAPGKPGSAAQSDVISHGHLAATAAAGSPAPHHRRLGLFGGIAAFLVLIAIGPPEGMPPAAWNVLAVAALMACWWALEALPLAATALVPLVAFPLLDI